MKEKLFNNRQIVQYKNMPEFIAETLKEAILQGKLKGGTQLKQDEIAKQFDASLIPVREAIIQLEAKGLVKCIRNKGALVTTLSIEEMKQLFELRKILEVGIIKIISQELDPEGLKKLHFLLEKMEKEENIFNRARYNRLFHEVLCNMTHNEEISCMYRNLFVKVERYLMYSYYLAIEEINEWEEHKNIVDLLEKGSLDELISLIEMHIEKAQEKLINYISKHCKKDELDWNVFIPFQ